MTYSKHRILSIGYIEIEQLKNGNLHRHVIAPNESIDSEPDDVKEAVLADPNYDKYRTQQNADAYEQKISESEDI